MYHFSLFFYFSRFCLSSCPFHAPEDWSLIHQDCFL